MNSYKITEIKDNIAYGEFYEKVFEKAMNFKEMRNVLSSEEATIEIPMPSKDYYKVGDWICFKDDNWIFLDDDLDNKYLNTLMNLISKNTDFLPIEDRLGYQKGINQLRDAYLENPNILTYEEVLKRRGNKNV